MFDTLTQPIKDGYQKLWDWSYNAGTIVLARLTTIVGIITAGVSYMDWSPLWNLLGTGTEFNPKQGLFIGIGLTIKGIVDEIVRRSNTVVTQSSKLVSSTITAGEIKSTKKKPATDRTEKVK